MVGEREACCANRRRSRAQPGGARRTTGRRLADAACLDRLFSEGPQRAAAVPLIGWFRLRSSACLARNAYSTRAPKRLRGYCARSRIRTRLGVVSRSTCQNLRQSKVRFRGRAGFSSRRHRLDRVAPKAEARSRGAPRILLAPSRVARRNARRSPEAEVLHPPLAAQPSKLCADWRGDKIGPHGLPRGRAGGDNRNARRTSPRQGEQRRLIATRIRCFALPLCSEPFAANPPLLFAPS